MVAQTGMNRFGQCTLTHINCLSVLIASLSPVVLLSTARRARRFAHSLQTSGAAMARGKRARSESDDPEPDVDGQASAEHAAAEQQQPVDRREQMADIARRCGSSC